MDTAADATLIRVRDGRGIAIAEFGARAGGAVMMHFHATISSRLDAEVFDAQARERGVRVLGIDRPSAGRSDPLPGRRLIDWPADVADVADALGIERFAVVGQSAGGPHALACAHALPDRVTVAVPVNSLVPIAWQPELAVDALPSERFPMLGRRAPGLLRALLRGWGLVLRPQTLTPGRFARLLSLPESDRHLLEQSENWPVLARAVREGTRQDRQIAMREMSMLYGREGWGFDPFGLDAPVIPFVGEQVGGAEFARRIVDGCRKPGARVERFLGGHLGQLAPAVKERIVSAVAAAA